MGKSQQQGLSFDVFKHICDMTKGQKFSILMLWQNFPAAGDLHRQESRVGDGTFFEQPNREGMALWRYYSDVGWSCDYFLVNNTQFTGPSVAS